RRGRVSAALGRCALDKTRWVIAVVLPQPADATPEKFRASSWAKRARTDSSCGFTMFPTPLSQGRARGASAPIYLPKCHCRSAGSRADTSRCSRTQGESRLSFRKLRYAASLRDRRKHFCAAQDRERSVGARRFLQRARECSRLPPQRL